jgi:HAD superfamily hydrolase (TIGR01509 family)
VRNGSITVTRYYAADVDVQATARLMQAIIFDFDGLIIDTEDTDCRSWQELYEELGLSFPLDEWCATVGTTIRFDPFDKLELQLGRVLDRMAMQEQRRIRHHALVQELTVLPGVEAYMVEARARGLRLGIASSSNHQWVLGHVTRLGLLKYLDCILGGDDVGRGKPDPAVYLGALTQLGVAPPEAFALEDSPNGVLAAKRAGLRCIAVPGPHTRHLDFSHADLRLDSLAEVPLTELLTRLGELSTPR